jgi:hypothetical protein
MIPLFDENWKKLSGGYKIPYDPSNALAKLEEELENADAWKELWNELHHQGDVGEASYAAVPNLVRIAKKYPAHDWNVYALISTIEVERHSKSNPPLPSWLYDDYKNSLSEMVDIAVNDFKNSKDPLCLKAIVGFLAIAKQQIKLGALLISLDESEINELVENYCDWSSFYK